MLMRFWWTCIGEIDCVLYNNVFERIVMTPITSDRVEYVHLFRRNFECPCSLTNATVQWKSSIRQWHDFGVQSILSKRRNRSQKAAIVQRSGPRVAWKSIILLVEHFQSPGDQTSIQEYRVTLDSRFLPQDHKGRVRFLRLTDVLHQCALEEHRLWPPGERAVTSKFKSFIDKMWTVYQLIKIIQSF